MKKVVITTDCVCDIPESLLIKYDVEMIHFYIVTDHGWFKDMDEITSGNIVEYFERGGRLVQTKAPFPEEYRAFFADMLKSMDEVIHIAVSSQISLSCKNALEAAKDFDGKVHVVDSKHLSTGMAHLVIKASQLAKQGALVTDIVEELECMREKISTSFIAENANYLYRAGLVGKAVKEICEWCKIHPVLGMKSGVLGLKSIYVGNYEKAVQRYVKREMRYAAFIEKTRIFITHASCSLKMITMVKKEVEDRELFEEILVTEASATISSNCGANTIGVLFVKKR